MVAIPRLEKSCCGCSLETGSKIIAWLGLIGGILGFIGGIGMFFVEDKNHQDDKTFTYAAIVVTLLTIINVIFNIFFILGVYKRIPKYVLVWVWISTITLLVSVISNTVETISIMTSGGIGAGFGLLFTTLISLAIGAYLILVVYNYHRELTGEIRQI